MPSKLPSLRRQLMVWIILPVALALLSSTLLLYKIAQDQANLSHDHTLLDVALTLEDHLENTPSGLRLALSLHAENILLRDAPDQMYYAIYSTEGQFIAGTASLTPTKQIIKTDTPHYFNHALDKQALRNVVLRTQAHQQLVDIYVAETIYGRGQQIRAATLGLVLPIALSLLLIMLWIIFGFDRALRPLNRLRDELTQRHALALKPLSTKKIPSEVLPLVTEINALLARLEHAQSAQQRFIDDAAHQLRTPLSSLRAYAALSQREHTNPQALQQHLEHLHHATERASRLISQWLSLARLGEDAPPPQLIPVRLDNIIREHAPNWLARADVRQQSLEFVVERVTLCADGFALGELLDNLIDNALRYTPKGGQIRLSCRSTPTGIQLYIEDSGSGIPPDKRAQVFERFRRLEGAPEGGSGLGLAIVQRIAEQHHAQITIDASETLGGACFCISWLNHNANDC